MLISDSKIRLAINRSLSINKMFEAFNSFEFWAIFIILTVILYYAYGKWSDPCNIPGPMGLPILGYMPFMSKNPHLRFNELANKYGNIFQLQLGCQRAVVFNDIHSIKEASNKPELAGRPDSFAFRLWNETITPSIIFMSESKEQKVLRKAAMLAANKLILVDSEKLPALIDVASTYIIDGIIQKDKRLKEILKTSTASIVASLSFGKIYDPKSEDLRKIYEMNDELNGIFDIGGIIDAFPIMEYWYKKTSNYYMKLMIPFRKFVLGELTNHQPSDGSDPQDFQDIFEDMFKAKQSNELVTSLERLRLVGSDLFAAGFSTTADHIMRAIAVVATYPETQEKIFAEIKSVLAESQNDAVRWSDREKMPYTQSFMEELYRHFSHVPLSLAKAAIADTWCLGYFIPKGTILMSNLWTVHNDKSIFGDDVDTFRPERFQNSDGSFLERPNPKFDHVMAFGTGRRKCVGEGLARKEILCMLCSLVQKATFKLESWEGKHPLDKAGTIIHLNNEITVSAQFRK